MALGPAAGAPRLARRPRLKPRRPRRPRRPPARRSSPTPARRAAGSAACLPAPETHGIGGVRPSAILGRHAARLSARLRGGDGLRRRRAAGDGLRLRRRWETGDGLRWRLRGGDGLRLRRRWEAGCRRLRRSRQDSSSAGRRQAPAALRSDSRVRERLRPLLSSQARGGGRAGIIKPVAGMPAASWRSRGHSRPGRGGRAERLLVTSFCGAAPVHSRTALAPSARRRAARDRGRPRPGACVPRR